MRSVLVRSLDDPAVAAYRDLKRSNLTRWSGRFIAEGDKVVLRLLASDFEVESVLAAESFVPLVLAQIEKRPSTVLFIAPDGLIPQIVGFNFHRGLLACGVRRAGGPLQDLCPPLDQKARLVVCPDIQGPDNLGQILRTSCALGIDGVIVGPHSADPFSRRVLRVSMGAAFNVPIYESASLAGDLARLHAAYGIDLLAAALQSDAQPLATFNWPKRAAILLGGEGHGLDPALADLCGHRVTIPMQRGADSLNVAVAAGIFLHSAT